MPEYKVKLGKDETGQDIEIGDIERRSGLYILGIQGSGKTTLLKNLIFQDIRNGHGVFFLDPHGDAIDDLLAHMPHHRKDDVFVLDPTDDTHTFGINLFSCLNPDSLRERSASYAQAEHIFTKLFANPQTEELDILLSEYLPNVFYPLIATQGLTLLEIPLLLRDKAFRDRLLQNSSTPAETLDFWQEEFESLRADTKREETASTRRRINLFRTHEYVKHIVGQSRTTVDFTDIMDNGKILFVKLSSTLAPRVRDLIGTMLVSNLVYAVLQRERIPEADRRHFCIFVDEFQYFASSEDFAVLFTQGRKFAVATTVAHQERYGQFADNKQMLGATDTAGNKIFLQQSQSDAKRHAVLFAKASPTKTTRERILIISQYPVEDILRGHANPTIRAFVTEYLRSLSHRLEDTKAAMEREGIHRQLYQEASSIAHAQAQVYREDLSTSVPWRRQAVLTLLNVARAYQQDAYAQTLKMLELFERTQELRKAMRSLDSFLTAIMEGRVAKGQEAYVRFLLEIVGVFYPIFQMLALYVALAYGDSRMSRNIPFALACDAGMYPAEISGILTQAEERRTQEWQALQERYRAEDAKPITDADPRRHWGADEKRKMEKMREWMETAISKLIVQHRFEVEYFWHIARLYTEFIWLECFPGLRSLLSPYSSARFTEESQRFSRSTGFPYNVEGLIRGIAEKFQRSSINSRHLRYMRSAYISKLLTFLRTHKEGAFVILALLDVAGTDRGWRGQGLRFPPDVRSSINLCMVDFPGIDGMDPLETLRLIQRINAFKCKAQQDFPAFLDRFLRYFGWLPQPLMSKFLSSVGFRQQRVPSARQYLAAMTIWEIAQYGKFHIDDIRPLDTGWLIQSIERRYGNDPRPEASVLKSTITSTWETFSRQYPPAARVWSGADDLTRSYLIARACDLACLGETPANATFPLPRVSGADAFVSAVGTIIQDIITRPLREQMSKDEARWRNSRQKELTTALARISRVYPEMLPARVPSAAERTALIKACLWELRVQPALTVITDLVRFLDLLARPENHIQIPSTQYRETRVNLYTTQEMVNQMEQELLALRPPFAYVKLAWKGKIATLPFRPSAQEALVDMRRGARENAIKRGILKPRSGVEAEIRERQERWRRPPDHEPSPTDTGGNSPPLLPSGGAGEAQEPPPTTYILDHADEIPPYRGEGGHGPPDTDASVEAPSDLGGRIIDFTAYRHKRRQEHTASKAPSNDP